MSDLSAMRSVPTRQRAPQVASPLSLELERRREFSRPFYDTGEHVLAGDVYAGAFHVGKSPGVEFSYGQLVSMGDLYESVDDMMNASAAELTRLKALIVSDTAFYSGKKTNKALGVSNETWDKETGGRFLQLAADNFEHFSPANVAMGAASRTAHGDNKSQWEAYHRRAIEEAQKMWLASSGQQSIFYEWPLTINAFVDHFLTDAFASGHMINKEVMIDLFKSNFFSKPGDLNSAGADFFRAVAKEAWWGRVSYKFSQLETSDGQIRIPVLGWKFYHPQIDDAATFGKVLIKAAEEESDRVGNLLVKTIHDRLNDDGVEVTNRAADGTWFAPGDGSMKIGKGRLTQANLDKNFGIIRKAVQQSIDNVNSDETHQSNLNFGKFFERVWRFVPQPTSAGQSELKALIKEYSDPHSATLIKAAADLIHDQLDSFLHIMVDEKHKLQPS